MNKYNIQAKLNNLSMKDYAFLLNLIKSGKLGFSLRSFYRWKKLKIDEDFDISAKNLFDLSRLFNCNPDELYNYDSDIKPFEFYKKNQDTIDIAKKHNLELVDG